MVPVTSLEHYPDLCLLAIFKHMPLHDLLRPSTTVGLVCTRWYVLCRTELHRRRSLTVVRSDVPTYDLNLFRMFPYENDLIGQVRDEHGQPLVRIATVKQASFDAIPLPWNNLNKDFMAPLVVSLPSITHLSVAKTAFDVYSPGLVAHFISSVEQTTSLIELYSKTLIDLNVNLFFTHYVDFDDDDEPTWPRLKPSLVNLFDCINGLSSLRHLKLFMDPWMGDLPQLTILSKLASFSICHSASRRGVRCVKGSLRRSGSNLCAIDCHLLTMNELLQLDRQLSPKFRSIRAIVDKLRPSIREQTIDQLELVCSRFGSLTNLKLALNNVPMLRFAQCLVPLSQLLHLDLFIVRFPKTKDPHHFEVVPQIPSVRALLLGGYRESHNDTERLFVDQIFPRLETLFFQSISSYRANSPICLDCGITSETTTPDRDAKLERCNRLARQPFRRCANLRAFSTGTAYSESILIPVNQI